MNKNEILEILNTTAGNPTIGPVADIIPTLADAINDALNPTPTTEQRITKAKETR